MRNLDYIFTVSSPAIAGASLDTLGNLEKSLDLKSSEPWSYRHLPTSTATLPAVIYSEEDSDNEVQETCGGRTKQSASKIRMNHRPDSFLQSKDDSSQGIDKEVRALRKKLQQIEMLEEKQSNGYHLDDQQIKKLNTRSALENSLAALGVPVETTELKSSSSVLPDGKGNKNVELSRKQRRKNKHIMSHAAWLGGSELESSPIKGFVSSELYSDNKEEDSTVRELSTSQTTTESAVFIPKEKLDSTKNHMSLTSSKKKTKKVGLSMFLSGALDDSPKSVVSPPTPKSDGPAWGGAKISKGFESLPAIQDEEIKTKVHQPSTNKDPLKDPFVAKGDGKILLSSFLPSKPIPVGASVVSASASLGNEGEKCTPPWTASVTPPARPSLRDIQMQQKRKQQNVSHSPKTKTAGFSVTNSMGSPLETSGQNRWFKLEVDAASSIRSIQIEEKAIKDLRRFYDTVRVAKNTS